RRRPPPSRAGRPAVGGRSRPSSALLPTESGGELLETAMDQRPGSDRRDAHDRRDVGVLQVLVEPQVDGGPLAPDEGRERLVDPADLLIADRPLGQARGVVRAVEEIGKRCEEPPATIVVDDCVVGYPEEPCGPRARLD